jgi:dihydroflavonol-4-reductase
MRTGKPLETPAAKGRYLCAAGNMSMAEVVALMRSEVYSARLPRFAMTGRAGAAMMKLASYAQPTGVGSYLRTHLGRKPRFDTAKIRGNLGVAFRPVSESIRDTLADLARWGHSAPPIAKKST